MLWQHQQETKTSSVAIRPRADGKDPLPAVPLPRARSGDRSRGQGAPMQLTLISSSISLWLFIAFFVRFTSQCSPPCNLRTIPDVNGVFERLLSMRGFSTKRPTGSRWSRFQRDYHLSLVEGSRLMQTLDQPHPLRPLPPARRGRPASAGPWRWPWSSLGPISSPPTSAYLS